MLILILFVGQNLDANYYAIYDDKIDVFQSYPAPECNCDVGVSVEMRQRYSNISGKGNGSYFRLSTIELN